MTEPTPLDPDQVRCRRCGQEPGSPCRQPNNAVAREIHVVRRRDAVNGGPPPPVAKPKRRPGKSNLTPAARAKGNKASAQARRRRAAELAAEVEAARVEAAREAIEREAAKLAEDASRYARDRAVLRRHVLDGAARSYERLLESLRDVRRVQLDDDGRVVTEPIEHWKGDRLIRVETPIVRGGWEPADVERIAKVAAAALNSLRLEEGKPTGIERVEGPESDLQSLDLDELVRYAKGDQ